MVKFPLIILNIDIVISNFWECMKKIFCVLILLFICGCTKVYIAESKDSVVVTQHFGFVNINASENTSLLASKIDGIGLVKTVDGFSLGYHSGLIITATSDCKIVLLVQNQEEIRTLAKLLEGKGEVCVVDP